MRLGDTTARFLGLALGAILLILLFSASLVYGYTGTGWRVAYAALQRFDGSNEHLIIRDLRLPRAVIATIVGAALAVSGALMQALTRNPMASPGILGINAAAGLFIVAGVAALALSDQSSIVWFSLAGALSAAVAVYGIASAGRGGLTPLNLTLAGATLTALCMSFMSAILIADQQTLDSVLFWLAGSVEGKQWVHVAPSLPFLLVGFVCVCFMGRVLNVISVGEDVAKGLGQNTGLVKVVVLIVVVLLAGGSVAIAGPIGFIGLMVPHLARGLCGTDYRWVIPYSVVIGACLLLAADVSARFVAFPKDIPVGIMTAIVGAPFFIYMARRRLTDL